MRKTTLCAVLFAAAFGVHCAQAAQTLRVATESTFPPFEYVNTKTGDIEGFDMDLIRLLAKKAGYNIEIANMGFDAIVPGILTNTVDIGAFPLRRSALSAFFLRIPTTPRGFPS